MLATAVPGWAESLQYDRERVAAGETGRLISGTFVHWTARMAFWDLIFVGAAGAWIEWRSRARLAIATVIAVVGTGTGVHLLAPAIDLYRGSSGLATALFVVAAAEALREARSTAGRVLGVVAIALLLAKIGVEMSVGTGIASGPLPVGVRVMPLVHGIGVTSGAVVVALFAAARLLRPSQTASE